MASPIAPGTGRWQLPELPRPAAAVPFVDRATMAQLDRVATDQVGVRLLQLMENAGYQLADLTRRTLGGSVIGRRIMVLAGTGNNAGGGMVAGRRLAGWGADVCVAFARPVLHLRPAPCSQVDALLASGARAAVVGPDLGYAELRGEIAAADAVLDALVGYSLRGAPDAVYESMIGLASAGTGAVISLDLPSGVDAESGTLAGTAVTADATLALALPKRGIEAGEGRRRAGTRYLADIGMPPHIFPTVGLRIDGLFGPGPVLRLD